MTPQVPGGWSRKDSPVNAAIPAEAAEDVEPVGAQRPEADEQPGRALAQACHHADHQDEDHAEADRLRQRRGAVQALEGVRAVQRLQDHREREHEGHQQQQGHRRPAEVVAAWLRAFRNPMPIPRKLASRTKLVALVT